MSAAHTGRQTLSRHLIDVYIYVDQPLNMVVVARLKDTGIDNWSQKLRPGYATLF